MGGDARPHAHEIVALGTGVDLGLTVIESAEIYGDGETKMMLGGALAGLRNQVFLVSQPFGAEAR